MARIPESTLDRIRQSNDVVEVIGTYLPLKRKGAGFWALCPFHKEKSPSFQVNPQKQIWHCFGCGAGGNVFRFLMQYEGLEFMDAVRRLAERANIPIEFDETPGAPSRNEKDALLQLHEAATNFFHHNLLKEPAAEPARAYLKKRQITAEIAKKWRLGYSPDSWDALLQWARSKKFSPETVEAAGLALRGDRGLYDRFRGRLMFPICDEQGRPVAFSGRILTDAKDQPKYVNSPETAIFQKGKILFALDKAKRAILDDSFAIVCEGQIDTISCHEAGLINVVAPQGTALTEQHARILKRYTDEVVLMFDADAAGQKAAHRSADPLLAAGLVIRVAVLPGDHDPDSFIKEVGTEALKKIIADAPGFFAYLLAGLSQEHDPRTDRGKLQIAQQVVEFAAKVSNAVLRSAYIRQTAERLDIPETALLAELRKHKSRHRTEPVAEIQTEEPASELPAARPAEDLLLQLLLTDDRVIGLAEQRLDRQWLSSSRAAELIGEILTLSADRQWNGPDSFLNRLRDEESSRLVSALLMRPPMRGDPAVVAGDCLTALERDWLEGESRRLRIRLAQSGLKDAEILQIQGQVLDLRRKLDHIAALLKPRTKQ